MNTTHIPILAVSPSTLLLMLVGAIIAIAFLVFAWSKICSTRDWCIERESVRQAFVALPAETRAGTIEWLQKNPDDYQRTTGVTARVVKHFAKIPLSEMLATLIEWHDDALKDHERIAATV